VAKLTSEWLATIRGVVEDVTASDVAEFELVQKDFRVRLKRRARSADRADAADTRAEPDGNPILAPFTGIFYRSSSPTAEPYVHEGDWVDGGATIGLIETMKIFNEVKAEQAGRVSRVLVESGQLVHAGDALVMLTPGERPPSVDARL
jgi:acetyl/propionyl-CoA carboxylase alpha subunit